MLGFFSENRQEYVLTELACISDSITVVPIPIRAASAESLSTILNQTELETLCVTKNTLQVLLDIILSDKHMLLPHLKYLVNFDGYSEADLARLQRLPFQHFTLAEIIDRGWKQLGTPLQRNIPTEDSVHLIIYSSGTTGGPPKAAMLTHLNLISGLSGGKAIGYTFNESDVYLSYVPASHI